MKKRCVIVLPQCVNGVSMYVKTISVLGPDMHIWKKLNIKIRVSYTLTFLGLSRDL